MTATRNVAAIGLAAALLGSAAFAPAAFAQKAPPPKSDGLAGAPTQPAPPPAAPTQRVAMPANRDAVQTLTMSTNKTSVLEFDTDIDDIVMANPAIADAVARDRRHVYVMGKTAGESNIIFLDAAGRKMLTLEVSVTDGIAGMDQLRGLIKKYVPNNKVQVESVNGKVILAGAVPNLSAADRVVTLARQYAKDDASVLNMMSIEGKDQVALKVRIVEMQRTVIKQLGINLSGSVGFGEVDSGGFANVAKWATQNQFGVAGSALGGLAGSIGYQNNVAGLAQSSITANLQALERVGLLRTLAEPNLTAISGESAKFLAGGEFPVPVAQDQGKISVEFKPFGVGLGFTPVVLSEGRISLQVSTEVSELTQAGAFSAQSTGSSSNLALNIPALKVRRAETTIEMPSGGSMVIAGLIQEQTKQSLDAVPGVKDMPVLGALFRSRDFQNSETELVVIVTPYLVEPTDPQNLRDPDRGMVTARDSRTILFGKLNDVYAVPGSGVEKTAAPKGSSGFIFD
jgi:pilus assembly protein CpaC